MKNIIAAFILLLLAEVAFAQPTQNFSFGSLEPREWHLVDNSLLVTGSLALVKEGIVLIESAQGQWAIELNQLHWTDRSYIIEVLPLLGGQEELTPRMSVSIMLRLLGFVLLAVFAAIVLITTGDGGLKTSTFLFISTILLCIVLTSFSEVDYRKMATQIKTKVESTTLSQVASGIKQESTSFSGNN